jgi:molecular chaperone GrpE
MNEQEQQPDNGEQESGQGAVTPSPEVVEDISGAENIDLPDFSTASPAGTEAAYWEAIAAEANEVNPEEEKAILIAALQQENLLLKAQLEERAQQIEGYKSQYSRLGADFENFRKRTAKEKEELDLQVKGTTIKELLPVVDNFDRARSHIKPQNDGEMNIHKSYQSVYKQLVDCLKRVGVSPMRPEGEPFDPNFHEAVMREPTSEYPEGAVVEQLVRGYLLGEKVLRHAMVKVAAPPEDAPEPSSSEESAD